MTNLSIINATNARANLFKLIEDVNTNSEPVTIVNSKGANAVLVSEQDWKAIQETIYLNAIPHYVESVIDGMNEPEEECEVYTNGEEW